MIPFDDSCSCSRVLIKNAEKKNSARFQPSNFQYPLDTMFHLEVIFNKIRCIPQLVAFHFLSEATRKRRQNLTRSQRMSAITSYNKTYESRRISCCQPRLSEDKSTHACFPQYNTNHHTTNN